MAIILNLALPWLLSVLLLIALWSRNMRGDSCLVFGASLIISHVLMGFFFSAASQWSFEILRIVIYKINPIFSAITLIGLACFLAFHFRIEKVQGSLWYPYLILSLLIFLIIVFLHYTPPAQGWDALDSWLVHSKNIAYSIEKPNSHNYYYYDQRHPLTVPALMMLPALLGNAGNAAAAGWLGAIPLISMMLICFGFSRFYGIDRRISFCALVLLASGPLINNHVFLFGYADAWLASMLVAVVGLSVVFLISKRYSVFALLSVSLVCTSMVKNFGWIFATRNFCYCCGYIFSAQIFGEIFYWFRCLFLGWIRIGGRVNGS